MTFSAGSAGSASPAGPAGPAGENGAARPGGAAGAGTRWVVATWAGLALIAAIFALPEVDELGLYYDEAFLAQQARDFVEPGRHDQHAGSVRSVELLGRPFPVRNAAYLGSLKSQLLIPVFLVAGASVETLRVATFVTGWLAVLLTMLFALRSIGLGVALVTGLLLASDPSFYFFGRFEWGPFTTNFLLRAVALLMFAVAWQSARSPTRIIAAAAGGVALGLGVFSRADFGLIVGGLLVGVAVGHWPLVREAIRERRGEIAAAAGGLVLASAPMWLSIVSLIRAGGAVSDRGDIGFRTGVWWSVLDGSQFHRLMQTGGLFEAARDVDAPAGLFGIALALALAVVALDVARTARSDPQASLHDPRRFLLVATVVITGAMLALPGAVRAHHQLNGMPFAHILVACAATVLWRRSQGASIHARQVAIALGATVLVAANIRVIVTTSDEIDSTGGRGRWTSELRTLVAELEAEPGAGAVSLDWGFHEPLLFMSDDTRLDEAIWAIPRAFAAGRPWTHAAGASTRYLVHDEPYDLFGLGPLMLAFARAQPAGTVEIEPFTDASGEVAFHAIRILRPHRLSYTGRFKID